MLQEGRGPLHYLIDDSEETKALIKLFLEAGADPTKRNKVGNKNVHLVRPVNLEISVVWILFYSLILLFIYCIQEGQTPLHALLDNTSNIDVMMVYIDAKTDLNFIKDDVSNI